MKNKQRAKFFCENCGAEVPENAKVCKNCGRFFSSVRCPQCGTSGPASLFKKGCPKCGYAMPPATLFQEKNLYKSDSMSSKNTFQAKRTDTLPCWIYILTIGIFVVLIVALYSCLK
jgi:uncharacterized membrane protein YvbJ